MTMAPSSSTPSSSVPKALSECWPSIHPFLDLPSIIAVSASCPGLRSIARDKETGGLMVSTLEVDGDWQEVFCRMDRWGIEEVPPVGEEPWVLRYSDAKVLLGEIHFPSLAKLTFCFPAIKRTVGFEDYYSWNGVTFSSDEALAELLSVLAAKLGDARSLEELTLDANSLVRGEGNGEERFSRLWGTLGENLAGAISRNKDEDDPMSGSTECRLRKLEIFNDGTLGDSTISMYGCDFLAAMVPVLRAARDSLEELLVEVGNVPSRRGTLPEGRDFFGAVLRLNKLESLTLKMCTPHHGSLSTDLHNAVAALDVFPLYGTLKKVKIFNQAMFADGTNSIFSSSVLAAMVPILGRCSSLEDVTILCGDQVAADDHENIYLNAAGDFFGAVLRLPRLRILNLQLCATFGPVYDGLIEASGGLDALPSRALESASLLIPSMPLNENEIQQLQSLPLLSNISPFLNLLRGASTLCSVMLRVPAECWREGSIAALGRMLEQNPSLSKLIINFYKYPDLQNEHRLMDRLLAFLERRRASSSSLSDLYVSLENVGGVDEESDAIASLRGYISPRDGLPCLRWNESGLWDFEHRPPLPSP